MDFKDLMNELQPFMNERRVPKGNYLFRDNDRAAEIFYIKEGVIQLKKTQPDGREFAYRILSGGNMIVETNLFEKEANYPFNAVALEDSVLYGIPKDDFEAQLLLNPQVAAKFFAWLNKQYRITQSIIRDLLINGKKGALYSILIRLANSYGQKVEDGIMISLQLTNQELANFCGSTREVVNRLLQELKEKKVLSFRKRHIVIHDLQYLRNEVQCEKCPISICTFN
ncbi:MAG: Crp/Fnr family transcriptional regulator [Caldibacillus debilis]|jgi:CRP/FNR family transcriptional regulator|uniref:Transcriptional regulator, Crp/Fnr family n=2 Tax=Caldibacillus debilis TaxID=301148 RepID=A0A420VD95_9BACI|nr:Crp/Fnr family transcriptional regulator [Caldibacillus debilis]MBO2481041.1 Crp/Fnr family transcriptional regulator [Bacillaceae bacterium]KYD10617.1 hypothetical protein B4135_3418 [Caldibacillus debilis]MBY6272408.1 Crp/Fnr family transcriptional regulator [Bacillaceae bacterium]OUM87507.1 MAG: Crp/Fnr family transcriptional regulator [Caldibacillus debilis]REJ15063.1 MAG: Crp/Fnr family transcriptional regulator [Caldibacillus debilis]